MRAGTSSILISVKTLLSWRQILRVNGPGGKFSGESHGSVWRGQTGLFALGFGENHSEYSHLFKSFRN